jgi:hypothetical protein
MLIFFTFFIVEEAGVGANPPRVLPFNSFGQSLIDWRREPSIPDDQSSFNPALVRHF